MLLTKSLHRLQQWHAFPGQVAPCSYPIWAQALKESPAYLKVLPFESPSLFHAPPPHLFPSPGVKVLPILLKLRPSHPLPPWEGPALSAAVKVSD